MTRDMTLLGTLQFMSPEAALGQNSALDGRADQWSLAVIMYLCLTGGCRSTAKIPSVCCTWWSTKSRCRSNNWRRTCLTTSSRRSKSDVQKGRTIASADGRFCQSGARTDAGGTVGLNLARPATDAQPAQAVERPRVQPSPQPASSSAAGSAAQRRTICRLDRAQAGQAGPNRGTPTPQFDPPTVPQTTPSALPAPTKLAPVRTLSAPSGNTPTNIVLNDAEMRRFELLSDDAGIK